MSDIRPRMSEARLAFLLFLLGTALFTGFYALTGAEFPIALGIGAASSALLVYGGWFILVVLESNG